MKKRIILLGALVISSLAYSQVGINTDTPKATLDVEASPDKPTLIDGFIAPRLAGNELKAKDDLYTTDQLGAIVYATAAANPTTEKTVNVTEAGYYYFDGTVWVKLSGGVAGESIEPWYVQNTSSQAENNTDNIYQQGKVAVGFDATDAVSEKQLEVKGDLKAVFKDSDNFMYGLKTAEQSPLDPSTRENLMYVTDNEDINAANIYSILGVNKKNVAFMNRDNTGGIQRLNTVLSSSTGDGGLVALASETSTGKYAYLGGITWTETVEAAMQTRQKVDENNIEMDLYVRPKSGITFKHSGVTDYGTYTFPKNAPIEGQVLVGSSTTGTSLGRQLEWKDLQEAVVLKSPGGNCFKIAVNDAGALSTTPVTCL